MNDPAGNPPASLPAKDESLYAMLCHLLGLSWLVGIPGLIGSLVIWLWKREESSVVDEHGKEAVNFQISLLIYGLVLGAVLTTGAILTAVLIGFLILPLAIIAGGALYLFGIVFAILAALEANKGNSYRYPLIVRFIR